MKKVDHYTDDAFEFHKTVVSNKRDEHVKTLLSANEAILKDAFDNYDFHFNGDSLIEIESLNLSHELKKALLSLYRYDATAFRNLKNSLTTVNGKVVVMCPMCTIDTIGSFDHILPKEEYAEFVDHPKNLIPCCTTCNSKKNMYWKENGTFLFLNLYLDDIPEQQYLFLSVTQTESWPILNFSVKNENDIDEPIFNRILSHYSRLDLCRRFEEASGQYLSEIQDSIRSLKDMGQTDDLIHAILDRICDKLQLREGPNFWKVVLLRNVVSNPILYSALISDRF